MNKTSRTILQQPIEKSLIHNHTKGVIVLLSFLPHKQSGSPLCVQRELHVILIMIKSPQELKTGELTKLYITNI